MSEIILLQLLVYVIMDEIIKFALARFEAKRSATNESQQSHTDITILGAW